MKKSRLLNKLYNDLREFTSQTYTVSDMDAVTIEPTAIGVHALLASKAKPGDSIAVSVCVDIKKDFIKI